MCNVYKSTNATPAYPTSCGQTQRIGAVRAGVYACSAHALPSPVMGWVRQRIRLVEARDGIAATADNGAVQNM